jgi:nitrogen-specific signal transduction histidine kinase
VDEKQMGALGTANPRSRNNAMLLLCDAAGKVQAITGKESGSINAGEENDVAHFFGFNSVVNQWFLERLAEAQELPDYSAEANLDLEDGDTHVFVRVDSLKCQNEHYRFVLQLCPSEPELSVQKLRDGDSIVTRRQWHEIKNHIGALRLYVTFLKRRMSEGDDRQIVDKVLQGVNALIGYLDRIRRGDPQ